MAAAIKKSERDVFNSNKTGTTPAKKLATKTKLIAAAGRVFTCFFTLCFHSSAPIPLPHSLAARAVEEPGTVLYGDNDRSSLRVGGRRSRDAQGRLWRVEQHRVVVVVVVVVPQIKKGLHAVQLESSGGKSRSTLGGVIVAKL